MCRPLTGRAVWWIRILAHLERLTPARALDSRPAERGSGRSRRGLDRVAAGATHEEILADDAYLESDDIRAVLAFAARQNDHPVRRSASGRVVVDAQVPPARARRLDTRGHTAAHVADRRGAPARGTAFSGNGCGVRAKTRGERSSAFVREHPGWPVCPGRGYDGETERVMGGGAEARWVGRRKRRRLETAPDVASGTVSNAFLARAGGDDPRLRSQ